VDDDIHVEQSMPAHGQKTGASDEDCTEHRVVIRPYPKVIFFYPTFLVSVFCWLVLFTDSAATPEVDSWISPGTLGLWFFLAFTINILVISFEFSRIVTITIFVAIVAVLFGALWLDGKYDFLGPVGDIVAAINIQSNQQFYGMMSLLFTVIYIGVFVNTRFNYFEITHNEILHHHGYLGDIERFPAPSLRMTKEINDIFEFLLAFSGRLILFPANERKAIVLDNVLNVNRAEERLTQLLGKISVKIH
jgi:hypothetical protein